MVYLRPIANLGSSKGECDGVYPPIMLSRSFAHTEFNGVRSMNLGRYYALHTRKIQVRCISFYWENSYEHGLYRRTSKVLD